MYFELGKRHPSIPTNFPFSLTLHDLYPLGYMSDTVLGSFLKPDFPLKYVQEHPECHVTSRKSRRLYNRFIPDAESYAIATGDANPELTYDIEPMKPEDWEWVAQSMLEYVRELRGATDERDEEFADKVVMTLAKGAVRA